MFDARIELSTLPLAKASARRAARATHLAAVFILPILIAASSRQPAAAAVLEIGPGGSVTIYDAPGIVTAEGTRPIIAQMPVAGGAAPPDMHRLLATAAHRYALSEELLRVVAWQESRFRASAISPKGAVGPMQLMAGTARDLGVDRYDPSQNVLGGAAYLRQMLDHFHGDVPLALAAYNAGPGAIERSRGIPPFPETRRYVGAVLGQIAQSISSSLIINH